MEVTRLLNQYNLAARAEGLSPKTVSHVKLSVRLFAEFMGGIPDVRKVTVNDFRRFVVALQLRPRWAGTSKAKGQKISGTSINTYCRGVKSFWNWLGKEGVIKENPLANVPAPKKPKRLPKFLTEEELTAVLKAVKNNPRDAAILTLLIDSGIRLGELVNLEPEDIDRKGLVNVRAGKGDKQRHAFVSPATELSISTYKICDRPDPANPVGGNKLFLTMDGRPLTPRRVQAILERIGIRAGLRQRLSPHRLRHSYATQSLKYGANLEHLRTTLGHSDIKTTEVYLHLADADVAEAHRMFSPMAHLASK